VATNVWITISETILFLTGEKSGDQTLFLTGEKIWQKNQHLHKISQSETK